jgi:DNA-binding response OmpR family regulator
MSTGLPILVVACNQRNLDVLAQFLGKTGYKTHSIKDLHTLALLFESSLAYGLAMVDISGFEHEIWQHCKTLSSQGIPLLIIAPQAHQQIQYVGLAHGAKSVMFKPLVAKQLLGTVNELFMEV